MAHDEAFQAHERLTKPIRALLGGGRLGVFHFAWVIPGIALTLFLWVLFLRFLMHLPRATRRRFLSAAALFLAGAIGGDLVGGYHAELHTKNNLTYGIMATAEEALEMAGVIVLIWALLRHLTDEHDDLWDRCVGRAVVGAPMAPGTCIDDEVDS